jgi:hypothetical protein
MMGNLDQSSVTCFTYLSTPYDDSGNQGLLIEVVTDIIYENHIERFSEVSKQKIYSRNRNHWGGLFIKSSCP